MTDNQEQDGISLWSRETEYLRLAYKSDPAFQERFRLWQRLLDIYGRPGMKAIDMGCGTGVFSLYLAEQGLSVVGVDGSAEMLAVCREEMEKRGIENARFLQATLPDVQASALSKADLIISSSVLEYIPSLDETLALFVNLLQTGGTLILSMPNRFSIGRTYYRLKYRFLGHPEVYGYIRHYSSPGALSARLRKEGFHLLEHAYYAHGNRVARLCRRVHLPPLLTEDLFVAVLQKR